MKSGENIKNPKNDSIKESPDNRTHVHTYVRHQIPHYWTGTNWKHVKYTWRGSGGDAPLGTHISREVCPWFERSLPLVLNGKDRKTPSPRRALFKTLKWYRGRVQVPRPHIRACVWVRFRVSMRTLIPSNASVNCWSIYNSFENYEPDKERTSGRSGMVLPGQSG